MTRDEIIKMAESCSAPEWWEGRQDGWHMGLDLERFAALVAAAEREACAKVAEETPTALLPSGWFLSERVANAIRARGEK